MILTLGSSIQQTMKVLLLHKDETWEVKVTQEGYTARLSGSRIFIRRQSFNVLLDSIEQRDSGIVEARVVIPHYEGES